MPLKNTNINASLFPNRSEQQTSHHEHGGPSTSGSTTPGTMTRSRKSSLSRSLKAVIQSPNISRTNTKQKPLSEDDKIILLTWAENDPDNPMNWSKARKWMTTMLLCFMCLFIGLSTAAYSSGVEDMCRELGVSRELGQVGMFVFNASFAIVPMFLGPLSEFVGRNPIYLGCYTLFTIFFIPLALAKNIGTVIAARLLSGCFGAAGTTIIPGTLADIWSTEERGLPVAAFSFVAVFGTVAAPLYSGFINETIGWRWIEWIQLISNGTLLVLELVFLKETRGSLILNKRAKKLRMETGDNRHRAPGELEVESIKDLLNSSTTRAFILMIREPVVFFFSIWLAFAWAIIFLFFSVIPLTFTGNHHFSQGIGGLPYISSIIGVFIGLAACFHQNHLYDQASKRNNGVAVPEARLYWSRVGAVVLPLSLFWFSWSQFEKVHWIVPTISLAPMLFSIYMIFDAVQNYLADGYGEYASSAISAQGFIRNMLAASFPLFGQQMFVNMGYQWAGTLCALIATLMIPLPFILIRYGERIRARSPYAAATTKIAAQEPSTTEKAAAHLPVISTAELKEENPV